jgi:hypothetical protein
MMMTNIRRSALLLVLLSPPLRAQEQPPVPDEPMPQAAPPAPALDPRVPLYVDANSSRDHFTLEAGDQRCDTPCRLQVLPGRLHLKVGRDWDKELDLEVPPGGLSHLHLRSAWNWTTRTGVIMMLVGPAAITLGSVLAATASYGSAAPFGLGITLIVVGSITFVAGVAALIAGLVSVAGSTNEVVHYPMATSSAAAAPAGLRVSTVAGTTFRF